MKIGVVATSLILQGDIELKSSITVIGENMVRNKHMQTKVKSRSMELEKDKYKQPPRELTTATIVTTTTDSDNSNDRHSKFNVHPSVSVMASSTPRRPPANTPWSTFGHDFVEL